MLTKSSPTNAKSTIGVCSARKKTESVRAPNHNAKDRNAKVLKDIANVTVKVTICICTSLNSVFLKLFKTIVWSLKKNYWEIIAELKTKLVFI